MDRSSRGVRPLLAHGGLAVLLMALVCAAAEAESGQAAGDEPGEARRADLDRRIAEIDALVASAHFHTALGLARKTLRSPGAAAGRAEQRARLEVLAATAEVALGQTQQARRSLVRALQAQPDLVFDERETSPKLLELARQARLRSGIEEPQP